MGARKVVKRAKNKESGQALIEFIIMLPAVLAIFWYLLKVNMAINTSIVNQKHVRSQTFLKMLNHPNGPVLGEYKENPGTRSVFFMGVSSIKVEGGDEHNPAPMVPMGVGFEPRKLPEASDEAGEVETSELRQNIRVRTSFGICTARKPQKDGSLGSFCGKVDK